MDWQALFLTLRLAGLTTAILLVLAIPLAAVIVLSPVMRHTHYRWLTPTHTLIHLDGIAWGSLLALGLYTLRFSRRAWVMLGLSGLVAGLAAAATIAGGTAFLDSALAIAFAGAMLASIAASIPLGAGPGDPASASRTGGIRTSSPASSRRSALARPPFTRT